MDDRKLLELAAKAAGYELLPYTWNKGSGWDHEGFTLAGTNGNEWDPLEDDGEALRLAIKLQLRIEHGKYSVYAGTSGDDGVNLAAEFTTSLIPRDRATRRAILRAAAAMQQEDE